jgi:hypothetical protein
MLEAKGTYVRGMGIHADEACRKCGEHMLKRKIDMRKRVGGRMLSMMRSRGGENRNSLIGKGLSKMGIYVRHFSTKFTNIL